MKKNFTTLLLMLSFYSFSQKPTTSSTEQEAFYNKLMPIIKPAYKNLVTQTAKQLRNRKVNEDSLFKVMKSNPALSSLNGMDIEALCFLVLMQASQSAQDDLKSIMSEVKSINNQKSSLRNQMQSQQISSVKTDSLKKKNNVVNTNPKLTLAKKDSLSDISQMQQIRLQMAMDRKNQLESALSNMMKKISSTQNQIIQNLK